MATYFEDLFVGRKLAFGSYQVTREEVLAFATQYDPQPFHTDDDAAAKSLFGRLAASGWHTCAMTMRMLVDHYREIGFASLGGAGIDALRWHEPVYPGDTLRCELEILSLERSASRPERGRFISRMGVFNQNDAMVMSWTGKALVGCRERP